MILFMEVQVVVFYNLDGIETGTVLEDRAAWTKDARIPGTSCGICRIKITGRRKSDT